MDSSSKPNSLFSFERVLPELQETITYINRSSSLKQDHHNKLIWLSRQLTSIKDELIRALEIFIDESQMVFFTEWLAKGKKAYYDLLEIVNQIEPVLSHLLDLVDEALMSPELVHEFNELFDMIEDCMSLGIELKVRLNSKMPLLEASLEFNDISKDNIDTLEAVIDTNINLCFEVQEERFVSPIRHPPSFTLKQVVRLLMSHTNTAEPTIPTFSPAEEALCRKFLDIKRTVSPIEKSLTEILPVRIDHFGKRTIIHIDYLKKLLKDKHRVVLDKQRIMIKEVRELKKELVDRRWNSLFLHLNHELQSILDEIENLGSKLHDYRDNLELQERVKEQSRSKINAVNKTFNVIYRALEFSLLDVDVASTTNELAQRWLDMRPQSDRILRTSSSSMDETSIDSLSLRFRSFSMGSTETAETEHSSAPPLPPPTRGKFGALLLKKMNIKPVMVTSPTPSDTNNPFLDNTPLPKDDKQSKRPNLMSDQVPQLAFEEPEHDLKRPETPLERPEPTLEIPQTPLVEDEIANIITTIKNPNSLEDIEAEKIDYYAQLPSQIPKLQSIESFKFNLHPPKKSNIPWTPYAYNNNSESNFSGRLLPPTPLTDILTTKKHLLATHDHNFMTKI